MRGSGGGATGRSRRRLGAGRGGRCRPLSGEAQNGCMLRGGGWVASRQRAWGSLAGSNLKDAPHLCQLMKTTRPLDGEAGAERGACYTDRPAASRPSGRSPRRPAVSSRASPEKTRDLLADRPRDAGREGGQGSCRALEARPELASALAWL